ncbi:dihydrofolate reductase family protein [Nesterenkonia ebinurensis]|uniref:dihydrofolate reductase family protein n=1 Tax=Nesterenkonia ebinurensis TaxID=2608252 RepID=UPI00123D4D99|nr:hypothetical protein [Nesterenkonia ebinurensis]
MITTTSTTRSPQVFAFIFCSLDGFVEDTEQRLDWNTDDPELFVWKTRQARQSPHVGTLLLGRRTYDHFAEFWLSPEAHQHYPEIAAFMHEVPTPATTASCDPACGEQAQAWAMNNQLRSGA